jgi:hypothetical protein
MSSVSPIRHLSNSGIQHVNIAPARFVLDEIIPACPGPPLEAEPEERLEIDLPSRPRLTLLEERLEDRSRVEGVDDVHQLTFSA